jgi:hypothetical protein
MPDYFHAFLKLIDHHRGIVLAAVICTALGGYLLGCRIQTTSLVDPDRHVTPQQLRHEARTLDQQFETRRNMLLADIENFNVELAAYEQAIADRIDDLERQEALRAQIVSTIGGFATDAAAGTFNPVSAITALISLLGIGAASGLAVDNFRKQRVIQRLKTDVPAAA